MRRLICLLAAFACSQNDTRPREEPLPAPQANLMATVADGVVKIPRGSGVTQKLFADDVPSDALALSIAIETLGGVSTVLIPRDTMLPAARTEVFSTAADDQQSVEVHVVQGERPLVKDNRSLGKFQLLGIPPAPRGVPQIEVTFAVDARGVLSVSARDRATGATKEIRIEALSGTLDKAAVDKILAQTAAAKADDGLHRDWSVARNELDAMIYGTRKLLQNTGAKLSAKTRKRCEAELKAAESVLALSTQPGNPALLRAATETLRKVTHAASEELYRRTP